MTALIHPALIIVSDSIRPQAVMGASYTDTLTASGSTGTFTWRLTEGDLPAGLTLDSRGIISGTPSQSLKSRFVVSVTTDLSTSTKILLLSVGKPALEQQKVLDQLFGAGSLSASELKFLDLLGNKNDKFDLGDVRAWLIDGGRVKANVQAPLDAARSSREARGRVERKPLQKEDR
jgi:hypothetical protein